MHRKKIRRVRVNKAEVRQAAVDSQVQPRVPGVHLLEHSDGQTSLLFSLATELLLEIISYFPKVPGRVWVAEDCPCLPTLYCKRPDVLQALSQTCRALRKFFLPLYWENLDVCTNRLGGAWHLHVSSTLEARSIGLCRRPDLAAHVRYGGDSFINYVLLTVTHYSRNSNVNVILTRCSTDTVLPEFVRCLGQLPNVQTLQIVHAHTQMTTVLGQYFENLSLPSVHTVVLQAHAHNILRCCPEVRTVICTEGEPSKLVSAIRHACPKVEVIQGFRFNVMQMKGQRPRIFRNVFSHFYRTALIRSAPNLRSIELPEVLPLKIVKAGDNAITVQESVMEMLSSFKNLSSIEILRHEFFPTGPQARCAEANKERREDDIKGLRVARNVLLKSTSGEKKSLKVVTRMHPVLPRQYASSSDNRPATATERVKYIEL
jgi:hypothetical protein